MPALQLYNTMTRQVEPFVPADGTTVRMYACGPTVYNPAHLGNFRTFVFVDLLRRVLALHGWGVRMVMNLTDVDDKIIRRASERGVAIREITEPVSKIFFADRDFMRLQAAEHYPRATDTIPEMIDLVRRLMERGVAYLADDGSVYFSIRRFEGYGKLSRLDTREIRSGARVAQDDYSKDDAQDFALWKAAKPEDEQVQAAWDSPWGRGRPGWHLECSAMAMKLLGETLDIHCGGVDLVFPHHEDEIAQSEAATGKPFARVWCHGEFLLTDGAKMAKRVGNALALDRLRDQGVTAPAIRYLMFSTHYRKPLNLTDEALEGAGEAVRRIGDFADRLAAATGGTPELAQAAEEAERDAREAFANDLHAPQALAVLAAFMRRANAELDRKGSDTAALERARRALGIINGVLDLLPAAPLADDALRRDVEAQIAARAAARARGDFATADQIRKDLLGRGIVLEDSAAGTRWKQI